MIVLPPSLTTMGKSTPMVDELVIVTTLVGPAAGVEGIPANMTARYSVLRVDPMTLVACNLNLTINPVNDTARVKVCSNRYG